MTSQMGDACAVCTEGHEQTSHLCINCFKVWYDSGIVNYRELARETRWRKSSNYWPWSSVNPTLAEIEAMQQTPLP